MIGAYPAADAAAALRAPRLVSRLAHGANDDTVDASSFANGVFDRFGSGAGTRTRNVRKQGDIERWQTAQGCREKELHGQMSERTSLMRGQREMATALIACVLLFAGATAAAAQTQNYPASPYFSRQTAPRAPSPYYGTNANQNRNRGYLFPNVGRAGHSSEAHRRNCRVLQTRARVPRTRQTEP
jgi:hypothetical protein